MSLSVLDYSVLVIMAIVLIIGGYQFYFFCQRLVIIKSRSLHIFIDDWFPLYPIWVWIYTALYYPMIILAVFTVSSMEEFNYIALSFIILLFMHMAAFLLFPVELPKSWRQGVSGKNLSERLLKIVHKIDAPSNCFPSMHVSVAMLTALHILNNLPSIGLWIFLFPLLTALSALYTKQHYFLDVIPGAFFGWIAFKIFQLTYAG
ncbi:phosphatase PAP2 family protein [Candidatus Woesearchaeota archaeon]|nr:phosphatase PAP2 family protein [Candidatus Woesearchaeota archaeon]